MGRWWYRRFNSPSKGKSELWGFDASGISSLCFKMENPENVLSLPMYIFWCTGMSWTVILRTCNGWSLTWPLLCIYRVRDAHLNNELWCFLKGVESLYVLACIYVYVWVVCLYTCTYIHIYIQVMCVWWGAAKWKRVRALTLSVTPRWTVMSPGEEATGKTQMGGTSANDILSSTNKMTICPKTDSRWQKCSGAHFRGTR